ncbi:hypothetical protein K503DRAFT_831686 [Rhizopogon vinicolor AM-OR11-026]|uniref:Uncharacterized protein n=1 Tax=Rhizopogon vinicolor AM-OR11-026 TaxID=1314800 RepID=A0A1B7MQL5_9AGAM|nr:hypothetical protein K503DRAFT_831686 [Rhizopogon vinicolor AM-OR11-026]
MKFVSLTTMILSVAIIASAVDAQIIGHTCIHARRGGHRLVWKWELHSALREKRVNFVGMKIAGVMSLYVRTTSDAEQAIFKKIDNRVQQYSWCYSPQRRQSSTTKYQWGRVFMPLKARVLAFEHRVGVMQCELEQDKTDVMSYKDNTHPSISLEIDASGGCQGAHSGGGSVLALCGAFGKVGANTFS